MKYGSDTRGNDDDDGNDDGDGDGDGDDDGDDDLYIAVHLFTCGIEGYYLLSWDCSGRVGLSFTVCLGCIILKGVKKCVN